MGDQGDGRDAEDFRRLLHELSGRGLISELDKTSWLKLVEAIESVQSARQFEITLEILPGFNVRAITCSVSMLRGSARFQGRGIGDITENVSTVVTGSHRLASSHCRC